MCTPTLIIALFTIAKLWKQPKCPLIGERIKNLWYIYTMEYYLTINNNEILPFATVWMDTENIIISEIPVNQSEKDKCHMILLIWESKEQYK